MLILKAEKIHKYYSHEASRLHILKGIDLDIREGEILSIIGPSGAGKSTLLHILGGLDAPDEGQVAFDGKNIYQFSNDQRASMRNTATGFIFQFYHLLPEFTALENVMLPAMIHGKLKSEQLHQRGESMLGQVGLSDRALHKPFQLSGGEQQRVAIARALVNSPRVIFCDEPTGNLDSKSGQAVLDLLLKLNKTQKQTLVIVTHDERIARVAHRVVRMTDGTLTEESNTKG